MKNLYTLILLAISSTAPLHAQLALPANMYADSLHAPFYYGVTSGDPKSDAVIIWTHLTTADTAAQTLTWQVATDTLFNNVVQTGTASTGPTMDFTVKVDVSGLNAGSTYYYRFVSGAGDVSIWGRAKTLPAGNVAATKIAVFSCSSIFSGFFNAYRRAAERDDLQLVLHLGDYIYDFVDEDEEIRVPTPFPTGPQNETEWAERHRYYLLDPDLREARRMQTWVALWDNHDLRGNDPAPMRVFRRWLPIRETPRVQQNLIYRNLSIGDLVGIDMVDGTSRRNLDTFPSGEANMLDSVQFEWLTQSLRLSNTAWHIIGTERMMGGWYTYGIDPGILAAVPNDGPVFDAGSWDGYVETRERLLDTIAQHGINNCLVVSGDAHITMAMDLVKHPNDSFEYDRVTGDGSVGAEFLPTSVSRGNFDEQGINPNLSPIVIAVSMMANPHHQHMEINSHGYGLLEINADSIIATPYYSEILNISNTETAGQKMVMINGQNRWKRYPFTSVPALSSTSTIAIYPNPANELLVIQPTATVTSPLDGHLYNTMGEVVSAFEVRGNQTVITSGLPNGTYTLVLTNRGRVVVTKKVVVAH